MKKLLSVLVAIAMCACLCLPAFAAEDILSGLGDSLGDLDLESFDVDSIKDSLSGITSGLGDGSGALDGIKDTLGGLLGGSSGEGEGEGTGEGGIGEFDPTGALSSFVESLDVIQITELFSGLTDAFCSVWN